MVHFLQIWAKPSKKLKSLEAIYLYPSERPHHAFPENNMFHMALNNSSRDIED